MKKIKLNAAKLQLGKEKITPLNTEQEAGIKGGATAGPTFCTLCSCDHECQLSVDIACAPTVGCPVGATQTPGLGGC